ncbi:TPA: hypothetical protein ACTXXA_003098 [Legionella anisa]
MYKEVFDGKNDPVFIKNLNEISPLDLFGEDARGRVRVPKSERKLADPLKTTLGIEEIPSFTNHTVQAHVRAIDHIVRDYDNVSQFVFNSYKKEIPFVGGISGSAAACFLSLRLLVEDILSQEELQEYAFCCMGYLVGAGAHSFHEVYSVAARAGVSYEEGRYEASIPQCFKQTSYYERLLALYPDLIKPEEPINKSSGEAHPGDTHESQNTADQTVDPTKSALVQNSVFSKHQESSSHSRECQKQDRQDLPCASIQ